MNHYKAREIARRNGVKSGLYHYTVMNDGYVYLVGYCSPWITCPVCTGSGLVNGSSCTSCGGKGVIHAPDACPGHPTEAEAERHYLEYLINHVKFTPINSSAWPKNKCDIKGCDKVATLSATIGFHMLYHQLCEDHANIETLKNIVEVGEFWSS